jgi:predicted transcriptional regulator
VAAAGEQLGRRLYEQASSVPDDDEVVDAEIVDEPESEHSAYLRTSKTSRSGTRNGRPSAQAYHWAMTRTQTMVQLTDDLVRALSAEAERRGISRSALIRTVLEEFLASQAEASIGRQIAEGYRRVPPATPDEWGDLSRMTEQATADLLVRLDAEERAAGLDPW